MPEFDAIGRDVFAAADSIFTPAVAGAFKTLWTEAGFDQADNPNHLWTVAADVQSDRFTLTATVKDGNVYVSPPAPHVPATVEELARAAADDVTQAAAEAQPAAETAPAEAPVDAAPATEAVPAEPPVEPAPTPVWPPAAPEPDAAA